MEPKASRFRSAAASVALRWLAARCSRKAVLLFTLSALTSTMLWLSPAPRSVASESKCGSATVSATGSRILLLTPLQPPTPRAPDVLGMTAETAGVTVVETVATVVVAAPLVVTPGAPSKVYPS